MKKVIGILLLSVILITMVTPSYAAEIFNTIDQHEIGIDEDLAPKISGVIGVIQLVGTGIAVIASVYLGIRYVYSSTDEKADIKKKLIPFVIGVLLFYGATGILQLIAQVAGWF